MPLVRPFLNELGLTENRGAKKKASTSPNTWAVPKSWEKPRLHLFSFKDLQDPSLGRLFLPSYQLEPRGGVLRSSRPTYLIASFLLIKSNLLLQVFFGDPKIFFVFNFFCFFLFFCFFVFFYFFIFYCFLPNFPLRRL